MKINAERRFSLTEKSNLTFRVSFFLSKCQSLFWKSLRRIRTSEQKLSILAPWNLPSFNFCKFWNDVLSTSNRYRPIQELKVSPLERAHFLNRIYVSTSFWDVLMTTSTSNLFALKAHLASALVQNVLLPFCLNLGRERGVTAHPHTLWYTQRDPSIFEFFKTTIHCQLPLIDFIFEWFLPWHVRQK